MRTQTLGRLLVRAALAIALGSFAWYVWPGRADGRSQRAATREVKQTASYVTVGLDAPLTEPAEWLAPRAQPRGADWIYDMFTPPEIFYDADTLQFAVSSPSDLAVVPGSESGAAPPAPFRLQLLGYVGGAGRYLGTFENQLTGEVFLARAGQPVRALGLEITDFTVARQPVRLADNLESNQWIATAVVRDEQTGSGITLRAGERSYPTDPSALPALGVDEDDSDPILP